MKTSKDSILLSLLLALCVAITTFGSEEEEDSIVPQTVKTVYLKGKVKLLTSESRQYFSGKEHHVKERDILSFRKSGSLQSRKRTFYTDETKWSFKRVTAFDKTGRETERTTWKNMDKKPESRFTFTYNRQGNVNEEKQMYADNSINVVRKYKYRADGLILSRSIFDENGKSIGVTSYTYENNTQKSVMKDHNKKELYRNEVKFDAEDREIEKKYFRLDGSLNSSVKTTYGKNQKTVERISFALDGITETSNYKYEYDNEKNMLKITNINKDGSIVRTVKYVYDRDKHGNWITRTAYSYAKGKKENGLKNGIVRRKITYFADK